MHHIILVQIVDTLKNLLNDRGHFMLFKMFLSPGPYDLIELLTSAKLLHDVDLFFGFVVFENL